MIQERMFGPSREGLAVNKRETGILCLSWKALPLSCWTALSHIWKNSPIPSLHCSLKRCAASKTVALFPSHSKPVFHFSCSQLLEISFLLSCGSREVGIGSRVFKPLSPLVPILFPFDIAPSLQLFFTCPNSCQILIYQYIHIATFFSLWLFFTNILLKASFLAAFLRGKQYHCYSNASMLCSYCNQLYCKHPCDISLQGWKKHCSKGAESKIFKKELGAKIPQDFNTCCSFEEATSIEVATQSTEQKQKINHVFEPSFPKQY